ncbi:hypothetical protein [Pseudoalteromonas tunicata]|uniref:hypothetical protein n=1 Tax=Pseudoalteromonas tunicata TaxID=314281 RepID=UPI00273FB5F9|nr:hypothetical protein [Pseudoalteromonas tunicata]MDP4982255.1 hypothetical protein [Pseudoalteromonas tunicata]
MNTRHFHLRQLKTAKALNTEHLSGIGQSLLLPFIAIIDNSSAKTTVYRLGQHRLSFPLMLISSKEITPQQNVVYI